MRCLSATILCVWEIWSGSNNRVYMHQKRLPPAKKKRHHHTDFEADFFGEGETLRRCTPLITEQSFIQNAYLIILVLIMVTKHHEELCEKYLYMYQLVINFYIRMGGLGGGDTNKYECIFTTFLLMT